MRVAGIDAAAAAGTRRPRAHVDWAERCTGGRPFQADLGGVNHCFSSLHCNLARFRGVMIRGKYGAVIGLKEPIA